MTELQRATEGHLKHIEEGLHDCRAYAVPDPNIRWRALVSLAALRVYLAKLEGEVADQREQLSAGGRMIDERTAERDEARHVRLEEADQHCEIQAMQLRMNQRQEALINLHRVRDQRLGRVVDSLRRLRSAMDQQYAGGRESLFKTWSEWVGCAIVALQVPGDGLSLEQRVADWVRTRIGPMAMHSGERAMRLLEEAAELAQAEGISEEMVMRQVGHVYGRPPGDPKQEAAGVAVTLLGWCASTGNTLIDIAQSEIDRIESKPIEQIRGSLARKGEADLFVSMPEVVDGAAR